MECCLKGNRRRSVSLTICFCICVYFLSHRPEILSGRACLLIPKTEKDCFKKMADRVTPNVAGARRLLSGPGSSPPRCNSKCGRCQPCQAVHVAVPPQTSVTTTEYYPEAWWCKCRNKLYKPY